MVHRLQWFRGQIVCSGNGAALGVGSVNQLGSTAVAPSFRKALGAGTIVRLHIRQGPQSYSLIGHSVTGDGNRGQT